MITNEQRGRILKHCGFNDSHLNGLISNYTESELPNGLYTTCTLDEDGKDVFVMEFEKGKDSFFVPVEDMEINFNEKDEARFLADIYTSMSVNVNSKYLSHSSEKIDMDGLSELFKTFE